MSVFKAKATEQHFRIAVRHIIPIAIGIEEQIRRLQDVSAAIPQSKPTGQVQTCHEIF